MKLLISLFDSKFVLTLEFHISSDWNFQSLPSYTPTFAHATLQFLGSGGDGNLEWRMLFILVIISTISMLMTTFAHKTTHTHKLVSIDLLCNAFDNVRCLRYGQD
jgi:hypothetical protein